MPLRFAFAGDRRISVRVLDYLLERGCEPSALLLSAPARASHAAELEARLPGLSKNRVFRGTEFRSPAALASLGSMELDYIVAVHFPYLVPHDLLRLPRAGVLNLHPAFLPFNRGWHTASWAILDGTPIGATLHFMDEGVDTGDIVLRRELTITPGDTADVLYPRLEHLELEVFQEAWPAIEDGTFERVPQQPGEGSAHRKDELLRDEVQRIDPEASVRAGDLLRRLRALTTNAVSEAAYYEVDGVRYRVQVSIEPDR